MVQTLIDVKQIEQVFEAQKKVIAETPLQYNALLSERYACNLFLKREDLQIVRSYKCRGAYNKMSNLSEDEKNSGIVCASAGNHAMGVAFSCSMLNIKGSIYMPSPTPKQKIAQVKLFGKDNVNVVLVGDTFDDAYDEAKSFCDRKDKTFIHPFNDYDVIAGQACVGYEIFKQAENPIDLIIAPIGGGGLMSGIGSYFRQVSASTKLIGVEPKGAPAMHKSLKEDRVVPLETIDKFVDGAAVKKVGSKTFEIIKQTIDDVLLVDEGKICTTILELYNQQAIVAEPAGALSIAALDQIKYKLKGKNVVCVLSGGNNDILRTEEIKERSMLYEGLKHYFIVQFPQRPGALKEFVNDVMGKNDNIVRFEYVKKNNKEDAPALIGIEFTSKNDYHPLIQKMEAKNFNFQEINENPDLFNLLV